MTYRRAVQAVSTEQVLNRRVRFLELLRFERMAEVKLRGILYLARARWIGDLAFDADMPDEGLILGDELDDNTVAARFHLHLNVGVLAGGKQFVDRGFDIVSTKRLTGLQELKF